MEEIDHLIYEFAKIADNSHFISKSMTQNYQNNAYSFCNIQKLQPFIRLYGIHFIFIPIHYVVLNIIQSFTPPVNDIVVGIAVFLSKLIAERQKGEPEKLRFPFECLSFTESSWPVGAESQPAFQFS
jgi:hypothetical protein